MINLENILEVMPVNIREFLIGIEDIKFIEELRLKANKPLILQIANKEIITKIKVTNENIRTVLKKMSNYSIYSIEPELKQGYITINGGHRVGICGSCVIENNKVKTIKHVSSLNIRVCKEIIGCSNKIIPYIFNGDTMLNTIIISPPKCGKTTLLRDITRNISNGIKGLKISGKKICVIDERSEICAAAEGIPQLDVGIRTDVLDNCPKWQGIMMAIRSMSPDIIVCDEIGSYEDIRSILEALNCGINLITTIHGFGIEDLRERDVFIDTIKNNVFSRAIVLSSRNGVGTLEYVYDFKKNTFVRSFKEQCLN